MINAIVDNISSIDRIRNIEYTFRNKAVHICPELACSTIPIYCERNRRQEYKIHLSELAKNSPINIVVKSSFVSKLDFYQEILKRCLPIDFKTDILVFIIDMARNWLVCGDSLRKAIAAACQYKELKDFATELCITYDFNLSAIKSYILSHPKDKESENLISYWETFLTDLCVEFWDSPAKIEVVLQKLRSRAIISGFFLSSALYNKAINEAKTEGAKVLKEANADIDSAIQSNDKRIDSLSKEANDVEEQLKEFDAEISSMSYPNIIRITPYFIMEYTSLDELGEKLNAGYIKYPDCWELVHGNMTYWGRKEDGLIIGIKVSQIHRGNPVPSFFYEYGIDPKKDLDNIVNCLESHNFTLTGKESYFGDRIVDGIKKGEDIRIKLKFIRSRIGYTLSEVIFLSKRSEILSIGEKRLSHYKKLLQIKNEIGECKKLNRQNIGSVTDAKAQSDLNALIRKRIDNDITSFSKLSLEEKECLYVSKKKVLSILKKDIGENTKEYKYYDALVKALEYSLNLARSAFYAKIRVEEQNILSEYNKNKDAYTAQKRQKNTEIISTHISNIGKKIDKESSLAILKSIKRYAIYEDNLVIKLYLNLSPDTSDSKDFYDEYILPIALCYLLKNKDSKNYSTNYNMNIIVNVLFKYYTPEWKIKIPMNLVEKHAKKYEIIKRELLPIRQRKDFYLNWDWVRFEYGKVVITGINTPSFYFNTLTIELSLSSSFYNDILAKKKYLLPKIKCYSIDGVLHVDIVILKNAVTILKSQYNLILKEEEKERRRQEREEREWEREMYGYAGFGGDGWPEKHGDMYVDEHYRRSHIRVTKTGKVVHVRGCTVRGHTKHYD